MILTGYVMLARALVLDAHVYLGTGRKVINRGCADTGPNLDTYMGICYMCLLYLYEHE